jgi:hypothetical protein
MDQKPKQGHRASVMQTRVGTTIRPATLGAIHVTSHFPTISSFDGFRSKKSLHDARTNKNPAIRRVINGVFISDDDLLNHT